MKLPFTPNEDEFKAINRVGNIIYQNKTFTFADCENVTEQIVKVLHDEGMLKRKENLQC